MKASVKRLLGILPLVLLFACGGGGGGAGSAVTGPGPTLSRAVLYAKAPNTDAGDNFGVAVALSADGNTMVVGAYGEAGNATTVNGDMADDSAVASGAAYVYVRDPSTGEWSFQSYLKAANAGAGDRFGIAVSISDDGNTVAAGAYRETSNATGVDGNGADNSAFAAGAAYVFVRSGANWSQQAYVKASNTQVADTFGMSVALSGDGNTLAVGAELEDSNGSEADNSVGSSGAVYVFARSGSVWGQQAYLKATTPTPDEHFGESLSVSRDGNRIAVGAPQNYANTDYGPGAAYLFSRSGTTWGAPVKLTAAHGETGDRFGKAVSISGDGLRVVVSAQGEGSGSVTDETDNSKAGSGAVYLFAESAGSWSQEAYLKASNLDTGDAFGSSVSLSRDGAVLAVGASAEKSAATGVDGAQDDNSMTTNGSGAAYLFERSAAGWSQCHYVKATNTDDGDQFGSALVLSADGKTLAVGAAAEASVSAWASRDAADDTAPSAGAVYVY